MTWRWWTWKIYKQHFVPTIERKDYNVMIDLRTYDSIRKIATIQRDDHVTDCLLDYSYFKNYYKMLVIDLNKQQTLDADQYLIADTTIFFTRNFKITMTLFFVLT